MCRGEGTDPVVEHLGPQRRLAHHADLNTQPGEVVVDGVDDRIGQQIAENGVRSPAVQRPGVQRQQGCLFDRSEIGDDGPHSVTVHPAVTLNDQRKTFTALAITSPAVDSATMAWTAIAIFAHRANGMVSVGEKAITLVRLTYR